MNKHATVFYGQVKENKFQLYQKDKFMRALSGLNGQEFQITLEKRKKQRSKNQNNYYWGCVIPILAEHFGYDYGEHEEIHRFLRQKFLGYKQHEPIPILNSTTELSSVEMEEYLESVRRWAIKEFNVNIPLPNETEYGYEK